MTLTSSFKLPADTVFVPVSELAPQVREQFTSAPGDFVITRPNTRTASRVIDADAAELIRAFWTPRTLIEAVLSYSQTKQLDPEQALEAAFPLLQQFINERFLVLADSDEAEQILPTLAAGDQVAGFEILRCIQVLEDTELYQVKVASGELAALKIVRVAGIREVERMFEREAAVLRRLDGSVSPALLATGAADDRVYLVMEWCPGVISLTAAAELRMRPGSRAQLLRLCQSIVRAYARLHAQGMTHSDVHPRNILVAGDGSVKLIDYGLTQHDALVRELGEPRRGGIGFFFEPQYAAARLAERKAPAATAASEQYAVAALLYLLLTGEHYLHFSVEREEMLRQIVEEAPLPFVQRRVPAWPEVEAVLAKALMKDPANRFSSMAEFAAAFDAVPMSEALDTLSAGTAVTSQQPSTTAFVQQIIRRLAHDGPLLRAGLSAPSCSVNYGMAGIAYGLYRMAAIRSDATLLSNADVWATRAAHLSDSPGAFYSQELGLTSETVGHISLYHTTSGVHAVRALIAHAMGDLVSQQSAIDAFVAAASAPCANPDLTLGRSSVLIGGALLLEAMPDHSLLDPTMLRQLGNTMVENVWREVATFSPIQTAFEFPFLGIAHGWAGLLYATLRWCDAADLAIPDAFSERLEQLAACAEPAGRGVRWRRKLSKRSRDRDDDYVPSWCNGSAGFVYLWTHAHRHFHEQRLLDLAEQAAWHAWEEPEMGSDLCCGLAGRAYSLLHLYNYTGEQSWLHRAEELSGRAIVNLERVGGAANSLYKGDLGVAVLAAELAHPEQARMPLFEAEGWPKQSAHPGTISERIHIL